MADYDNPRPSAQEVGTTEQVVAKDNLITFDKYINADTETVTNRKGNTLTTPYGASTIMDGYVDEVSLAFDQAISDIDDIVDDVDSAKTTAVSDINADVATVESAKTTAVSNINADVTTVDDAKDIAVSEIDEAASSAQTDIDDIVSTAQSYANSAESTIDGYTDAVESAKNTAISDIDSDVESVDSYAAAAKSSIDEKSEEFDTEIDALIVQKGNEMDAAISDLESDGAQAIADFNSDGAQAISEFNDSGDEAIEAFESVALGAISQAGYEVVGNFADGVTVSNRGEAVYLSGDYEGFYVWTGTFPKTVAAGYSPFDEDGWMLASTGYVKQANAIQLYGQTIDASLVIPVGQNAISVGPTIESGATVTIPKESQWVVLGSAK